MIYLQSLLEFIRTGSKNEPIPEIVKHREKLGIILIGAPGVGKSTFIKNFIHTKNHIKTFSTDDISLKFTKDPNIYHNKSSTLNVKYLLNFIQSGNSFIYDTTGVGNVLSDAGLESVETVFNTAKQNDYTVIFIHLLSTLDTSIRQNTQRERNVDIEYLRYAYKRQHKNMHDIKRLNPDNYYVIFNLNGKYSFYKYIENQLVKLKRK